MGPGRHEVAAGCQPCLEPGACRAGVAWTLTEDVQESSYELREAGGGREGFLEEGQQGLEEAPLRGCTCDHGWPVPWREG